MKDNLKVKQKVKDIRQKVKDIFMTEFAYLFVKEWNSSIGEGGEGCFRKIAERRAQAVLIILLRDMN
ncbi:MAG: hypothetical protein PHO36_05805 [Parabacteroides sp.]|nr:hypothetical protein [Parabacteroides sp.]